jgi:hypothetical protein
MLQGVASRSLLILVLLAIGLFSGQMLGGTTNKVIQAQGDNLQSLLELLRQKITTDSDFSVTFQFNAPLIKDDDVWWSVPYFDSNSELTRDLYNVGEDYVCFHERWGDVSMIRCTPFSNVVSIVYIDQ